MKRFFKSIIACICGLTIVFSSAVPLAFARDGVIGGVVDGVQSFTEWGVNNLNEFWKIIFGPDFNSASEEELKAAYDSYVETLPAPGYNSDGSLLWYPKLECVSIEHFNSSLSGYGRYSAGCVHYIRPEGHFDITSYYARPAIDCNVLTVRLVPHDGLSSFPNISVKYSYSDIRPVDGYYSAPRMQSISGYYVDGDQKPIEKFYEVGTPVFYSQSSEFSDVVSFSVRGSFAFLQGYQIVYKVVPLSAVDVGANGPYSTTTRPTSITGGNYGIVGDNGQITRVEDNSTIVNETNNTYYNPATGATVPITGWSYDYSDRSYKVTLESGDTVTVTYGDENITIQEGDTIYNVYYLVDGSGSETPITPPCEHTWAETSTTPATCTLPGFKLSTCSKCQQTQKDPIPALGHDWQVKQTVTTQYDDTGQLVQEGYTIYECSRCHEQYKSTDGTIPPGGGSGTDPGGGEGETIWDKLGNLIGAIGSGAIELIDAVLGKLLDALIVLAEKMMEKLKVVVETVLSIFDELPLLFGGFLDFLVAVFPFLPPELMTILTFGVIAIVFIGIIKAVRR